MEKSLKKLPFFMVLLTVLLCSYAIGVIGLNDTKVMKNRVTYQEWTPSAKTGKFLTRTVPPRVLYLSVRQTQKQGFHGPLLLASIASLFSLASALLWAPIRQTLFDSRRVVARQAANLQFRFIHSR